MNNKNKVIHSVMSTFLMLAATQTAFSAANDPSTTDVKCYGVVKAGMNDCATAKSSCAGSATKDNQADAFVFMPQGLCEKLAGGHLAIKPSEQTKEK